MHEHEFSFGRRHSASSSSNTSGSPRPSGSKLDPDSGSGSGRASSRRAAGRAGAGGRSGRGSPLASSSQHATATAATAVDAAAVAERLSPRATASAAAAVHLPLSDAADRPHPQRPRLQWARMKNAIEPVVQFMQMIAKNARDPVAVGDALLWLVLLPLEAMRRTARSPGAMALLRVTLEATAELLVAAVLAGAAICVTALHVLTEQEEGADGDSDKRSEPAHRLVPCCQSLQHESPLPVDAGGERCSPRPALSSPLPTSLH